QQDLVNTLQDVNRYRAYESNLSNEVKAADTLTFDANFNVTGSTGTKTTQTYRFQDSLGHCYDRTLTAANHVLTNVSGGYGCGNHY
ncbi:MAG: peptide-N(4)-(N-acetyl-beta-glucosaminyl)asparagine amidase, partial [Acidobacteriaceae bacterium]